MRAALACIVAALLLASNVKASRSEAKQNSGFRRHGNFLRDLNIMTPNGILEARFDKKSVNLGNVIYPGDTTDPPTITFYKIEPGCFYTFLIVDPDFPSPKNPYWRSFLMALYVNLRATTSNIDLKSAYGSVTYTPADPVPGTGQHRYILLLFKQSYEIDITKLNFEKFRFDFSVPHFAANYSLSDPIAFNYYLSQFPDNLEEACENKYNENNNCE